MVRMSTKSTAPQMFTRLAKAAEQAAAAVEKGEESLAAYGKSADEAAAQVGVLTKENSNLARSFVVESRESDVASKSLTAHGKAASLANKALVGIGVTSAIVFAVGVKGASDLQNATLQSAIAMGRMGNTLDATMDKMRDFGQVAFNMSKITGQSLADSMGVVSAMSSSGLNARQIKSSSIPIAQYGDIMRYGVAANKSLSYADSAQLGAGLVHDLRLGLSGNDQKDAADTAYGLARVAQLSYLSPHGPNAVGTQIRRMAPTLETFLPGTTRTKATQITELAAWVDRMGMLPFAGSAISQMATQMISPRSQRVGDSLFDLGIQTQHGHSKGMTYIPAPLTASPFFDKKSQTFDIMGALNQVSSAVAKGKKSGDLTAFSALFGGTQNMQRILTGLSTPEAMQAKKNIDSQVKAMGDDPVAWMAATQTQVMSTLSGQVGVLGSNLQTLATLLTNKLIPPLTTIANYLQNSVGKLDQALIDHPAMAQLGGQALVGGAIAGIFALAKAGKSLVHIFATLGKSPHLSAHLTDSISGAAGETATVAGDAARTAEVVGTLGVLKSLFISPLGKIVTGFGSKMVPVVGELALLYTTLELLVGTFLWINQVFGIHKTANVLTPAQHAQALKTYAPAVTVGGHGRPNYVQPVGRGPYRPTVLPANTGLGRGSHPQAAAAVTVRHTGTIKVALSGSSVSGMSAKDKNALADMVAEKLAAKIARETQFAKGGTQTVATDSYGGSDYHSQYGVPA